MMMKTYLVASIYLLIHITSLAQSYKLGNEWYRENSNRTFIKLLVAEEGIYRVHQADLLQAGHAITNVNHDFFHLYYRGEEVPMYIKGNQESWEYFEFFGERNDGQEEAIMYKNPLTGRLEDDLQPNEAISLFTDTSAYFLTWDEEMGMRYEDFFEDNYQQYSPETHFTFESRLDFHPNDPQAFYLKGGGGTYDPFYTLNCDYVTGEGYHGPPFSFGEGRSQRIMIPTPNAKSGSQAVKIDMRVFGHSNTQHFLKIEMNENHANPVLDTSWNTNQVYIKTFEREHLTDLEDTTVLEFFALNPVQADNNNICWASITYDRSFDMNGEKELEITDWNKSSKAFFQIEHINGTDSISVYDRENLQRIRGKIEDRQAQIIIPNANHGRNLYLTSDFAIKAPRIESARLSRLYDENTAAEYVIITHSSLSESALAFAAYRDSVTSNPINGVKVVYTDEIYDEYGYGSITPWAIKRFLNDALENWIVPPKYVLLWGKGTYTPRSTSGPVVPTYGYPASHYDYVSLFDENVILADPQIAIGRLNVRTNEDGFIYLEKVKHFEAQPQESWQKRGLFLGGGASIGEQSAIEAGIQIYTEIFEDSANFGGHAYYYSTYSSNDSLLAGIHHQRINEGVGMIYLFGHSTGDLYEINLWTPDQYHQQGRYPFIMANGMYTSASDFTQDTISFAEKWLFEPEGGCIAWLSPTSPTYLNPLRDYSRILYPKLFSERLGQPIGEVIKETFITYKDSLIGIQYRNHARQILLQGDPALILFRSAEEDFVWPGDANNDGAADVLDVLPIGVAYGANGPTRAEATIHWEAQEASDWDSEFIDGLNHKHADCDGNGQINATDLEAISLNYTSENLNRNEDFIIDGGIPLSIEYPDNFSAGDTVQIRIALGDSLEEAENIYGLAFRLSYNTEIVAEGSAALAFQPSWLVPEGDSAISLIYEHAEEGWLDMAISRIDQISKSGAGYIADISIVITDDLAKKNEYDYLRIELVSARMVDHEGRVLPLNVRIAQQPTTLEGSISGRLLMYPNPTNDVIVLETDEHINLELLELYDARGNFLKALNIRGKQRLEVSLASFERGFYWVKLIGREGVYVKKILLN